MNCVTDSVYDLCYSTSICAVRVLCLHNVLGVSVTGSLVQQCQCRCSNLVYVDVNCKVKCVTESLFQQCYVTVIICSVLAQCVTKSLVQQC